MERQNLTFRQMAQNALATYGFCILWVITAQLALILLVGWLFGTPPKGVIVWTLGATRQPTMFEALVWAPVFEEILYRAMPLLLAAAWDRGDGRNIRMMQIVVCTILFGVVHGSILAILFQGVLGYMLARLFIKNHTSLAGAYLSCVFVHFCYNYTLSFVQYVAL